MIRLMKPCLGGCGRLTRGSRCSTCKAKNEAKRGTTAKRGYGASHQRLRRQIATIVDAGHGFCTRCGGHIAPGTPWDLDHTDDRAGYRGPSCASCNRGAASGRRAA